MAYAKTLLWFTFILSLFVAGFWSSSTFLAGIYETSPIIRASIPSVGMLNIVVFLFWFVLFLVPSWNDSESQQVLRF